MRDGVLRIPAPKRITFYAFADDLPIVMTTKKESELERKANSLLLDDKKQPRSGSGKHRSGTVRWQKSGYNFRGNTTKIKNAVKYLGVMID